QAISFGTVWADAGPQANKATAASATAARLSMNTSLGRGAPLVEEGVGFQEEGQHQAAFVCPDIVTAAGAAPHVVAGAADAHVIGERAFEDESLLDGNMFVLRK